MMGDKYQYQGFTQEKIAQLILGNTELNEEGIVINVGNNHIFKGLLARPDVLQPLLFKALYEGSKPPAMERQRTGLLRRRDVPFEIAKEILEHQERWKDNLTIAENLAVPSSWFGNVELSPFSAVKEALARRDDIPEEIRKKLVEDWDVVVREFDASNRGLKAH